MSLRAKLIFLILLGASVLAWKDLPDSNSSDRNKESNAILASLSFTDITRSSGVFSNTLGGHSANFADIDNDGRPDFYITMLENGPKEDLLFHNKGSNRFVNEAALRSVADYDSGSHGSCFADLDNDGDYDLINGTTWGRGSISAENNIFRNNGSGYFTEVTSNTGIPFRSWPTRGVVAFDMDKDGDLDIFTVTNYKGSDDPPSERNEVYRNDGNFKFTAINSGDLYYAPAGQGATDTDFDGDGDIDIIAGNRTGDLNILRNNGSGNFTRISPSSIGIAHRGHEGVTMGDVDNDGDLDMLLAETNSSSQFVKHLYMNRGSGSFSFKKTFVNMAGYMGGFADLDNDGDLDLVGAGDEACYLNDGNGNFSRGPSIPVNGINDPRAIGFADIDNDGDLDFAVGAKRSSNWLIRNNFNSGNWLKLKLISQNGQAGAFGAKIKIYPAGNNGGRLLGFRESRSNNGYLGQNDPVIHFGLGSYHSVDVEVKFLDGSTLTHTDINANQVLLIDPSGGGGIDPDPGPVPDPTAPYVKRVNVGGDFYSGNDGREWSADQSYFVGSWGYVGGRTFSRNDAIANTTDDVLFQSERYRMSNYRFTVPNGSYQIQLLFAEIFLQAPGLRIFDLFLEGNNVLGNFDIYSEVGHDVALVKNYEVEVSDGILDIAFAKIKDSPKISAIEVTSSSGSPLPPPPPPTISKLVIITPSRTTFVDSTSDVITIQSQSGGGVPVNVETNTTITLSTTSTTGQFSLTKIPFVPVTSLVMIAGSNSVSFFYRDGTVGNPTITGLESPDQGWADAVQQETVNLLPLPPIISAFDPLDGSVGTVVSITGQHLSGVTQVSFNGTNATTFNEISAAEIKANVPVGASSGKIKVVTPGGEATSAADFTVSAPLTPSYVQRVNVAGSSYIGADGREWLADQEYTTGSWGYTGGRTFSRNDAIANTTDDVLFQSERYRMSNYRFTVPNGSYQIQLLFAEIFHQTPGLRIFDVFLEGNKVLGNFDIYAEVGHDVALVKNYKVEVSDGILDIAFVKIKDSPKISAIEVTSSSGSPLPPPPPPAISKLVIITPSRTTFVDSTSDVITIQSQSGGGVPVNVETNRNISLSTTSTAGQFSLTKKPFVPVTSLEVIAGSNSVSFFYRDGTVGNPTITGSESPDQGWADAVQQETVNLLPQPPIIFGFDPLDGSVGTVVSIAGQHLSGVTQVSFNGTNATTFNEISAAEIKANVPVGASSGKIKVVTPGGEATSAADFTVSAPLTPSYVQRVNVAGSSYIGADGREWSADQEYTTGSWGYVGGRTFSRNDAIANTSDDVLFQSERYRPSSYQFTVPNGSYHVQLLFAEIFHTAPNKRIFDVLLEDLLVLDDFDIFSIVGHDVALVREYDIQVNDGILDIGFVKVIDSPKISAIEITSNNGNLNPKVLNQDVLQTTNYLPSKLELSQNYPNPFNSETRIGVSIPTDGQLTAFIFDLRGREIKRIYDSYLFAGRYELIWDGTNNVGLTVSSGVYLLNVLFKTDFDRHYMTLRMVMLK